jgi:O-antigen/teichoic acid export membrane protein
VAPERSATTLAETAAYESSPQGELLTAPTADSAPFQFGALGSYTMMFAMVTVLTKAVSFIMLPLYTRYLTPADYGVIELIELSFDILTMVAGSRLLGGVFRYYHQSEVTTERRALISTGVLIICGGYFAVGLAAFAGAVPLARLTLGDVRYVGLVRLGALALSTSAVASVPPAFFRLQRRFRWVVAGQLARLAAQVGLNVLFLVRFHLGPKGIFLSTLIANVAVGGVMLVVVLRPVGFHFSRRLAGALYRFGGPLIVTQMATFILTFGDRYFLRAATDLTSLGTYTMAYQFAFALAVVTQTPFNLVWEPLRFEVAKRSDRDVIYARVFVYFNIGLLTLTLAIAMFVHDFLHLIATKAFFGAANVVPALLVAMVFQGWAGAQDIGILMSERTGLLAVANWIAAGVTLAGYALLIPRYAGWGAAIATVVGYAVRYICTYRFSQRLWPVRYSWGPVMQLIGLVVGTYTVSRFVPDGPLIYALPARVMLFVAYGYLAWRSHVLSPREREAARRFVRQVAASIGAALHPAAAFGGARKG